MIQNEKYKEEQEHLQCINKNVDEKLVDLVCKISDCKKKLSDEENITSKIDSINLNRHKEKYDNIYEVKNSPYFARMDFKFESEDEAEKIYFGKIGMEFEDQGYNIVDWRTPLGNIYYESSLGECTYIYEDNKGRSNTIAGTKLLKRSIEIKDRQIVKVQDLETLAEGKEKEMELDDKYLIECLNGNSSARLKDIIATIQKTQNSIIREDLNKVVFIQGCAGSGKSTIALHRIAYLLYYYSGKLSDEEMLVIAPNKIFIEYISQLLPELGAVNIKQDTYTSFVERIIGEDLNILQAEVEQVKEDRKNIKGHLKFKGILDKYISHVLDSILPKKSLTLYGTSLYTEDELKKIFFHDLSIYKPNERIRKFKNYIEKAVKDKINKYIEVKESDYQLVIEEFKNEAGAYKNFQKELSELITEKEIVLDRIKRQANIIVNEYLNNINEINAFEKYSQFINDKMVLSKLGSEILSIEEINNIYEDSKVGLRQEDLAGILYLYSMLNNLNDSYYKHIVIDECQDLNPLEIYSLKNFVYNNSFTIVGDVNQRILPNKVSYDETSIEDIFEESKNLEIYKLNRSYRSSYEIMMFAKEILKFSSVNQEYLPEPIERHGDKPMIMGEASDNEIVNQIVKFVKARKERYKNVAIVFRTTEACKKYYELLKSEIDLSLINEETSYNGGVCIFPAYLTKGFEFDMVLLGDCDNKSYRNNQLERNLLYVQSTRAMHKLVIMYKGTMSPLLLKIGNEYYDEKETEQEKAIKVKAAKESLLTLLNVKFGGFSEEIEKIIKEELDYSEIQKYITKAAIENDINKIFISRDTAQKSDKVNEEQKVEQVYSVDTAEENIEDDQYPIVANSWTILSDDIFIREVDRYMICNKYVVIPEEIQKYFKIDYLEPGNRKYIFFKFNNKIYKAYIKREYFMQRVGIVWGSDFKKIIEEALPGIQEKLKNEVNKNNMPQIQFREIRTELHTYEVTFIEKEDKFEEEEILEDIVNEEIANDDMSSLMDSLVNNSSYNESVSEDKNVDEDFHIDVFGEEDKLSNEFEALFNELDDK